MNSKSKPHTAAIYDRTLFCDATESIMHEPINLTYLLSLFLSRTLTSVRSIPLVHQKIHHYTKPGKCITPIGCICEMMH